MNDLQMTLLVVGGGGVAAMLAYNWWQDHRLRQQANERFGENKEDPLLASGAPASRDRTEPGLSVGSSTQDESENTDDSTGSANNLPATQIDKRLFVDLIVRLETPLRESDWRELTSGLDSIHRKKIVYAVANQADREEDVIWFKAVPFWGKANLIKASVQLANRKGPLSSLEFSEVLAKLRRFAEAHNGELEFPDMKDVVARAETLDQAAAALDTLLGLHCLMPENIDEMVCAGHLVQAGWSQKGHQWSLNCGEGGALATMVIHNAPGKRLLSFNIDVPNSSDPVKALGDVVTVCHLMNEQYGAPLMDDSGRILTTKAIEGIYEQLLERVRNLSDSGFKPGEAGSKVLFS